MCKNSQPDPFELLNQIVVSGSRPALMGIINVTPDSFSDGGSYLTPRAAIEHGLQLLEEGARILDIGGESTRPGASPVCVKDEIARVVPVIQGLAEAASNKRALISIDTRHADTMMAAVKAGAGMINDITALTGDTQSLEVAARCRVPVCLMHMQGTPQNMQNNPEYNDVVAEIISYLSERISSCLKAGIPRSGIIIDPGIGFGKTLKHNLRILNNVHKFKALGTPILIGASRKSFITKICGDIPVNRRLAGSISAALYAARDGADILRVHDVTETKQALMVYEAICNG